MLTYCGNTQMHHVIYVEGGSGNDVDFSTCEVLSSYTFDEDMAFIVDADDPDCKHLRNQKAVQHIDEAVDAEILWDIGATSTAQQDVATIEDVRKQHNIPATGGGKETTVVVMDSGIDVEHPLFSDTRIVEEDVTGYGNGDTVGHGTACAGQITRLAPEADIVSLRIFGEQGSTSMDNILSAYEWLHRRADSYDIVNMSWGAKRRVDTIDTIHQKLLSKGVQDVVAAGNSGGAGGSPATAATTLSVGASTESGNMADFSSWDEDITNPDLSAIGKDCRLAQASGTVMGQQLTGKWVKASGTSFAAPAVAGMIAKSVRVPTFAAALVQHATPLPQTEREGKGLANYRAAAESFEEESTYAKVWSFAGRDIAYIHADWMESGGYTATLRNDGVIEIN